MMFVGHRMEEIYRVADRIAVLRDGRLIGDRAGGASSPRDRAISMMVGRGARATCTRNAHASAGRGRAGGRGPLARRRVRGRLLRRPRRRDPGPRRARRQRPHRDRARAVRHRPADRRHDPARRQAGRLRIAARRHGAGIAYVSEDRIGQSLVMDFPILANASLPVLDKATTAGLDQCAARELALVGPQLERLRLRFRSYDQPVSTLSGGNQQKVVLAKWLATEPRVLILDEPTQGIDVQTKAEVHAMIADLARAGPGDHPDLVRAARADRHVRPHRGAARGHGSPPSSRAARRPRRRCSRRDRCRRRRPRRAGGRRRRSRRMRRAAAEMPRRLRALLGTASSAWSRPCVAVVTAGPLDQSAHAERGQSDGAGDGRRPADDRRASAQMLVLITRNIDLSVASVIGLAAYGSA